MKIKNNIPIVTVVIRTFNRSHLLEYAIKSALSQTFKDLEVLILDDCSEDNTAELVEKYAESDSRIRYVRHQIKMANVRSLNVAYSLARGKYLAYLDDDDRWRPRKIELQLNCFIKGGRKVGLVTGGIQYWNLDSGKKIQRWIPKLRGSIYWKTLGRSGNIFGPPSVVMIRKDVLDDVGGFHEDMPRGACQQIFRRIAKKYEIEIVQEVVLDYYYHKNAITSIVDKDDVKKCIKSYIIKIESTKEDLEKIPYVYADEIMKLCQYYLLDGQYTNSWVCVKKAKQLIGITRCFILLIRRTIGVLKFLFVRYIKSSIYNKVVKKNNSNSVRTLYKR